MHPPGSQPFRYGGIKVALQNDALLYQFTTTGCPGSCIYLADCENYRSFPPHAHDRGCGVCLQKAGQRGHRSGGSLAEFATELDRWHRKGPRNCWRSCELTVPQKTLRKPTRHCCLSIYETRCRSSTTSSLRKTARARRKISCHWCNTPKARVLMSMRLKAHIDTMAIAVCPSKLAERPKCKFDSRRLHNAWQ